MKIEIKEENQYGDNDVLSARHRLAGALKELVQQDGGDAASSDDDSRNRNSRSDLVVRKTKRRRTENDQAAYHHTYVMKLFDRSVDLAQFEENTPLYPICRAWMANQPRNPLLVIKRRLSSPEPNMNGSDSINAEVRELPPPVIEKVNRVPSPLAEQVEKDTSTEYLNQNSSNALSRDQLLQTHRKRWNNVRRKWHEQARKYEERYQTSTDILTSIYNRAQENMA